MNSEKTADPKSLALALYRAYETKDRALAESLIASDFKFSSPWDNQLDRDYYFRLCWTHGSRFKFTIQSAVVDGDAVFVLYEAGTDSMKFRNVERLTIQNGKITSVEAYFGWDLPHKVPLGQHKDP